MQLRKAFTLVEILIVVVILAILAAIVIPQFTNASGTAQANAVHAQLQTIRGQLELYKLHHNSYPTLEQMWVNLTDRTDQLGNLDAAGKYGPYLIRAPINGYTGSSSVVAMGTGTADAGWEYAALTGHITAVGFDENTSTFTVPGGSPQ